MKEQPRTRTKAKATNRPRQVRLHFSLRLTSPNSGLRFAFSEGAGFSREESAGRFLDWSAATGRSNNGFAVRFLLIPARLSATPEANSSTNKTIAPEASAGTEMCA